MHPNSTIAFLVSTVVAFATAYPSTAAQQTNSTIEVVLCGGSNFQGTCLSQIYPPGTCHDQSTIRWDNGAISSMKVPAGVTCTIYDAYECNDEDRHTSVTGDVDLGSIGWDNELLSYACVFKPESNPQMC